MIMQAMRISPQQFKSLLSMTGNSGMMNQTIGELFKNGTIQQAQTQAAQVNPQQLQQIMSELNAQNPDGQIVQGQTPEAAMLTDAQSVPFAGSAFGAAQPQKLSFFGKIRQLFKI